MKTIIVEKILIKNGLNLPLFAVAASQRNLFSIKTSLTFEAHLTAWTPQRELSELQSRYLTADDDGVLQDALMLQIIALQKFDAGNLWRAGKSTAQIERELGIKIIMLGSIGEIQHNFASGNFQITFSNELISVL